MKNIINIESSIGFEILKKSQQLIVLLSISPEGKRY